MAERISEERLAKIPPLAVEEDDRNEAVHVFGGRPSSLIPTRDMQDALLLKCLAEMFCRERQLLEASRELQTLRAREKEAESILKEAWCHVSCFTWIGQELKNRIDAFLNPPPAKEGE